MLQGVELFQGQAFRSCWVGIALSVWYSAHVHIILSLAITFHGVEIRILNSMHSMEMKMLRQFSYLPRCWTNKCFCYFVATLSSLHSSRIHDCINLFTHGHSCPSRDVRPQESVEALSTYYSSNPKSNTRSSRHLDRPLGRHLRG